jgi:hypothetical protein
MAAGGYQQPTNPAPVSGPGALSQRTDGAGQPAQYMSGLPYGQGQQNMSNQQAATLAGNPFPEMEMPTLTPVTRRPNEVGTTGLDIGAGADSRVLNRRPERETLASVLNEIARFDSSGEAELLFQKFYNQ